VPGIPGRESAPAALPSNVASYDGFAARQTALGTSPMAARDDSSLAPLAAWDEDEPGGSSPWGFILSPRGNRSFG
jgi:hypothetical protein